VEGKLGAVALRLITCESRAAAARLVARLAADALSADIAARGHASLLVSGGSTPQETFEVLSAAAITWNRVTVGLVDERWVVPDDAESNERLVRRHLLKERAAEAAFVPMWVPADDIEAAGRDRDCAYRPLCEAASFVLLGMGADGHVASWFPGMAELDAVISPLGGKYVMAVEAKAAVTPLRLTLTGPAVFNAKQAVLLVFGDGKRKVLEEASSAEAAACPVRYVLDAMDDRLKIVWAK
jgi:6-phosphogluconolactonase